MCYFISIKHKNTFLSGYFCFLWQVYHNTIITLENLELFKVLDLTIQISHGLTQLLKCYIDTFLFQRL